ncbi:hypothetical protein GF108_12385 [Phyllobacterium sp. SYP-B3895]|uniref:hypothetical protein n=1 Tax=Phyllobacterium sp. SYP-B3895 TaxID=2663240 RepID=UPI0012998242|nr:hypothetical protein [Phyllobacterium sp. SYP-B3895]MRG56376.1 hypothetical protein [Phyllobacterium sp. SYP-B3895]
MQIIEKNNGTFYNYRTQEEFTIWPRMAVFLIFSIIISFALLKEMPDFLNAINNAVSILLGFSFSVLFYLASSRKDAVAETDSLEKQNRDRRLTKLSNELFYNISYFVIVALLLLGASLIIIIPDAQASIVTIWRLFFGDWLIAQLAVLTRILSFAIRSCFFFLLMEAAFTFARIVGRVNFLFEEKMKGT